MAKFYAVGQNGQNEREIGPFGTIEEARRAGIAEMNAHRATFTFKGVMDESGKYVAANSTSPVVANGYNLDTPLKKIDYQLGDLYEDDATLRDLVDEYKMHKCVDYIDNHADTMAREKVYDALKKLTGIKNRYSRNSVVANALAWKAQNAVASNSSSFEIGVGDKVTVEGKTGFVKAKYFKGGKICIDVDVGSKTVTVEPKDVMKNSAPVARNADDWGATSMKVSKNINSAISYLHDVLVALKPFLHGKPGAVTDSAEDTYVECNKALKILTAAL